MPLLNCYYGRKRQEVHTELDWFSEYWGITWTSKWPFKISWTLDMRNPNWSEPSSSQGSNWWLEWDRRFLFSFFTHPLFRFVVLITRMSFPMRWEFMDFFIHTLWVLCMFWRPHQIWKVSGNKVQCCSWIVGIPLRKRLPDILPWTCCWPF